MPKYKEYRTKEQTKVKNKKYYENNKHKERKRKRLYWYKYKHILVSKQEEIAGRKRPKRCEACNSRGRICFDHCHKTGKFRGWICSGCNTALGSTKDNINTLRKLIKYLQYHKGSKR